METRSRHATIDFAKINDVALALLPAVLARLLPDGRKVGNEFIARNPRRADNKLGSFSINLRTGRWADFATGDTGGDPISLVAYLESSTQAEAARNLAHMVGVEFPNDR